MKIANLPLIVHNVGAVVGNRAAKAWRHLARRARRVVRPWEKFGRHSRTRVRLGVERVRDEAQHARVAGTRAVRHGSRLRRQFLDPMGEDLRIRRRLRRIAAGRGPIVVGPWLSEVGYEALYWVPFVRWFVHHFRVDPARVCAVSRGGVAHWYAGLADTYVELLDLYEADDLARRHAAAQAHGGRKQVEGGDLEEEILARVAERHGTGGAAVLHPSLMFRLLGRFWLGNASLEYLLGYVAFAPVPPGPDVPLPALPDRFTAVKFYTGVALTDTPEHRASLRDVVERLAARGPVVLLDTPLRLDEHEDFGFDGIPNVQSAARVMTPRWNLAVQTEIVRRASLFAGTAGGLAWLAPMLGVDTLAFYADDRFLGPHFYAARHAHASVGGGRLLPMDLGSVAALERPDSREAR